MGNSKNSTRKNRAPRRPVPLVEIELQLPDQLDYLRRSIEDYDDGHTNEYRRMASTLRVLLHDTLQSKSLLSQLGMQDILFATYSAPLNPRNLMTESSLATIRVTDSGASYLPVLDNGPRPPRWISLAEWKSEPVLRDNQRVTFSRWDFVTVVANQDGGAHVDSELDDNYYRLSRENSLAWVHTSPEGEKPMQQIERCYLRHIAWEGLTSIETAWCRFLGNRLCECGSGRKSRYCCSKD